MIFGILLRTGVLPGDAPFGGTVVPAAVAGGVMAVFALIALIPEDVERRIAVLRRRLPAQAPPAAAGHGPGHRWPPACAPRSPTSGTRGGALWRSSGAVGFWAANIGVLWAAFEAFGGDVPFAVLVQGFFVGHGRQPDPVARRRRGIGGRGHDRRVRAVRDLPSSVVFPAVLVYRVIAFWLPIPPGIVAYFQLRSTVARWEEETQAE